MSVEGMYPPGQIRENCSFWIGILSESSTSSRGAWFVDVVSELFHGCSFVLDVQYVIIIIRGVVGLVLDGFCVTSMLDGAPKEEQIQKRMSE